MVRGILPVRTQCGNRNELFPIINDTGEQGHFAPHSREWSEWGSDEMAACIEKLECHPGVRGGIVCFPRQKIIGAVGSQVRQCLVCVGHNPKFIAGKRPGRRHKPPVNTPNVIGAIRAAELRGEIPDHKVICPIEDHAERVPLGRDGLANFKRRSDNARWGDECAIDGILAVDGEHIEPGDEEVGAIESNRCAFLLLCASERGANEEIAADQRAVG